VFALAVMIFLNPWALRMGGRWTLALTWHGVGKLQSTSGASCDALFERVDVATICRAAPHSAPRRGKFPPSRLTAILSARGAMAMEKLLHFIFVRCSAAGRDKC
jgi:hypothetical protein